MQKVTFVQAITSIAGLIILVLAIGVMFLIGWQAKLVSTNLVWLGPVAGTWFWIVGVVSFMHTVNSVKKEK